MRLQDGPPARSLSVPQTSPPAASSGLPSRGTTRSRSCGTPVTPVSRRRRATSARPRGPRGTWRRLPAGAALALGGRCLGWESSARRASARNHGGRAGNRTRCKTRRTPELRRSPSAPGPGLRGSGCEIWAEPAIYALPRSTERAALSPAAPAPTAPGPRWRRPRRAHLRRRAPRGRGCPG